MILGLDYGSADVPDHRAMAEFERSLIQERVKALR